MEVYIVDIGIIIKEMAKEIIMMLMVISIKEIGKMENGMDMVIKLIINKEN